VADVNRLHLRLLSYRADDVHDQCTWRCRLLSLEFGHEVRRTGRQVAERVRRMLSGETLTGL